MLGREWAGATRTGLYGFWHRVSAASGRRCICMIVMLSGVDDAQTHCWDSRTHDAIVASAWLRAPSVLATDHHGGAFCSYSFGKGCYVCMGCTVCVDTFIRTN